MVAPDVHAADTDVDPTAVAATMAAAAADANRAAAAAAVAVTRQRFGWLSRLRQLSGLGFGRPGRLRLRRVARRLWLRRISKLGRFVRQLLPDLLQRTLT
jgi:hypothetical protein